MTDIITIVIPVYNVEAYIDKTLKSVCGQTYEKLQIILIDDGSTDKSLAICEAWEKRDGRIQIYHQENKGVASARNRGIESAQGKYLMFIDADDWIEPDMLEVLYHMAENDQADVSCCMLREEAALDTEQTGSVTASKKNSSKMTHGKDKIESGLILLSVWGPVCKLYRMDLIRDIRFEEYKVAEDLLFNTNVICSEKFEKATLIHYPFYHYVIYNGSAMKQGFQEKYIDAMSVEEICYNRLTAISEKFGDINLIGCSVSRVFEKYAALSLKEKKKYRNEFRYCKKFAKRQKRALLCTTDRHRKISGWLKVYVPDLYMWILTLRLRG